jgi:hypothetical protein
MRLNLVAFSIYGDGGCVLLGLLRLGLGGIVRLLSASFYSVPVRAGIEVSRGLVTRRRRRST